MGSTASKNSAQEIANVGCTITNSSFLNCQNNCGSSQSIICAPQNCGPNSQCNISNVVQGSACTATQACVQNASTDTTVNQSVAQAMQQTATTVSAGLGLSSADASNVADATANVSTAISNQFQTNLGNISAASQSIVSNACVTNIYAVDQNVQNSFSISGQQTTSAVSAATQQLTQTITQKATAVNLGLLIFLIGIALIIVALGYFVAKSGSGAAKIIIPIVIIAALGVAGFLTYKYAIKKSIAGPNPMNVFPPGTGIPPIVPGETYSLQLTASGTNMTQPLTWSVLGTDAQTQLQACNLTLDNTGLLSTPSPQLVPNNLSNTAWGGGKNLPTSILITAYVTDSTQPHPNIGHYQFTVPIANNQLTLSPSATIPPVIVGQAFPTITFTPGGSGATSPYFWSSVFPNHDGANMQQLGLVMNSAGVLQMQDQNSSPSAVVPPTAVNSIDFILYCMDSSNPPKMGFYPINLTVQN